MYLFPFQILYAASQVKDGMTAPPLPGSRWDSITKSTPDSNKSGNSVAPSLKVSEVPDFALFPVEDNC